MDTYPYIMPGQKRGSGSITKTIRFDPILLLVLEEFQTTDQKTQKKVAIGVLNHNAWMNPDIQLHVNVRKRYRELQRKYLDGKGTRYKDIGDFVRQERAARHQSGQ